MNTDKSRYQEVARTCTLYNMRKATRVVTDLYEAALSPTGISAMQFTLLIAVKNYEPVSMTNLAQGLHTDRTTLTRTLKPLQEKGWIDISPGKDRRVQEVRLTAGGDNILTDALPLWRQVQTHVQEQLGQDTWEQLLTHLHSVTALTG